MDDLISRQMAIDALDGAIIISGADNAIAVQKYIKDASDKIRALPSAEKHGRWVVDPEGMLHCSNCKSIPTNRIVVNADLIYDMTNIKESMKYCPKCGAKMGE